MSDAKIAQYNGAPTIMVDGQPMPPMAMVAHVSDLEYYRKLGAQGIRVFGIMCNTDWLQPGGEVTGADGKSFMQKSGYETFRESAQKVLEAVPDAYIFVRVGLHPPADWVKSHPDDILRYDNGSTMETHLMSEMHEYVIPGAYSMCSDAWRQEGTKALLDFCANIEKSEFSDRVIGMFLAAGGTSEWYYQNPLTDKSARRVGDVSLAFRAEYSRFLKEKYKTEDALKRAWNMSEASFENPLIPDLNSRAFTHVDAELMNRRAQEEYDLLWARNAKDGEEPPRKSHIGVFLNIDAHPYIPDFYDAWSEGTANSVIHFAKAVKANYPGKLVGAFYGAYGCTDYFDAGTTSTLRVLDSGALDFLASPGLYMNRQPGGYVPQREMQDSFRLRNMLFTSEEDSRTHLEPDLVRDAMQYYTPVDSVNVLKRDFARNLCEGTYAWWFDQFRENGRYGHPDILEMIGRQQEIAHAAYVMNREKNSEIALIYDQDSLHYVSQETSKLMLELYRATDLGRIGAPVDYYFHDDLARADMPDYKLYLMINTFVLTDSEREVIRRKASKNGATVIWLYASGFINPNKSAKLDHAHISDITGINVNRIDTTLSPRFKLSNPNHQALRLGDMGRLYGCIDRNINSCFDNESFVPESVTNPMFYIDDPDAEILGRYCINDLPALAEKKHPDGFTSVYCAPQILRSDLIASFASTAGVHLYSYDDDCIYANRNFVTVHAAYSGKHTLYFPKECSPYEVYERCSYGINIKTLEIDLLKGETRMFYLHGEI